MYFTFITVGAGGKFVALPIYTNFLLRYKLGDVIIVLYYLLYMKVGCIRIR